jgi:hypothetical protein
MYQTLYARLNVQKKHDECAELMLFGALQLLANNQVRAPGFSAFSCAAITHGFSLLQNHCARLLRPPPPAECP